MIDSFVADSFQKEMSPLVKLCVQILWYQQNNPRIFKQGCTSGSLHIYVNAIHRDGLIYKFVLKKSKG